MSCVSVAAATPFMVTMLLLLQSPLTSFCQFYHWYCCSRFSCFCYYRCSSLLSYCYPLLFPLLSCSCLLHMKSVFDSTVPSAGYGLTVTTAGFCFERTAGFTFIHWDKFRWPSNFIDIHRQLLLLHSCHSCPSCWLACGCYRQVLH
jgi:hypothetical protein